MAKQTFKAGDNVLIIGSVNTTKKTIYLDKLSEIEKQRIFEVINVNQAEGTVDIKSLKDSKVKTLLVEHLIKIKPKLKLNLDLVF